MESIARGTRGPREKRTGSGGRVPVLVEKRTGAFFRLVQLTTNAPLKDGLEAWRTRSLGELDVIYVYLDGFALRVRRAGKVVMPVLGVVGVLPDGHKQLLALELCGGESFMGWKGCLDGLVARGFAGTGARHHRRQCRAATRRRAGVAAGGRAALLCA